MPAPSLSILQVLGFEVDAVNSVQFSNHTGKALVSAILAEPGVGMGSGPRQEREHEGGEFASSMFKSAQLVWWLDDPGG